MYIKHTYRQMFWLLSGPLGFTWWNSFAPFFSFYVLSNPYVCFISSLYLDLYVGDNAWISYEYFMQTKHLCVLIHIWTKDDFCAVKLIETLWLNILLTVPRLYFFCGSFVINVLCLSCFRVCSLIPCGHLLGKGWPLGSFCDVSLCFCHFPMWYPGSCVVLDCIDSWSLPPFLPLQ